MPTDPLTGSRYPSSSAAPNINQDIQNAVLDLSDNTIPNFSTTGARDTAYTAWVALGNTMRSGLYCTVADKTYIYSGSTWRGMPRAVVGGTLGVTTSSGGDVNITHGLGEVPTFATVELHDLGIFGRFGRSILHTKSSTIIGFRVYDARPTAAVEAVFGSTGGTVLWSAWLL